ncbi:hypothetical protein GWN63_03345, partial [Candidatus Bathyarchaeota archaeon]|nr:hypothetical protein [Desulfobacterales bacterium]NIU81264.1 hypothetical protein [Candidatus Bathyarchaeota archaeon]NIV67908.1 hypothetical protein [Candidatus Bathyarchaeota archaeon]
KLCKDRDLELITRVDLAPRTSKELLRKLRRLRRKFEVVAVVCDSKSVARQAAKDRRVDLLSFPPRKAHNRFFDRAEAELASNALSCLEIDMAPVLYLKEFPRIRLLSNLRTETAIAKKFNVPIVISSGATNEHLMRNGHDYAALATLFEISISTGLRSLSEIPGSIVERNRKKLCSKYVAPGIQVIKEGEDCPDK